MEIKKSDFISIIKQLCDNEKSYEGSLLRLTQMKESVFQLEKKVNYLKSEDYDVTEVEKKVKVLKNEVIDEMKNMESMKKGNLTFYNWEYVDTENNELHEYLVQNEFLNYSEKKTVIKCSFDPESIKDFQKQTDLKEDSLRKRQKESKTLYQIVFLFDKDYISDDNISIIFFEEVNNNFKLLLKISYKDVIKFIVFNSDEEIVSSNLKAIKNDNFLLQLLQIIIKEADSKTSIFKNKVNRSIHELNLALDEVFLEKKDKKND